MPAINPQDLNNAKLDVDHMAALATSGAPTAVDRFGQTKKTWTGIEQDLSAAAAITQTGINRAASEGAAVAANAQRVAADASAARAEAARDGAQLSSGVYATTAAGLAATTAGRYFTVPSADPAESLILYRNSSGAAVEIVRYPSASLASFGWVSSQSANYINFDTAAKRLVVTGAIVRLIGPRGSWLLPATDIAWPAAGMYRLEYNTVSGAIQFVASSAALVGTAVPFGIVRVFSTAMVEVQYLGLYTIDGVAPVVSPTAVFGWIAGPGTNINFDTVLKKLTVVSGAMRVYGPSSSYLLPAADIAWPAAGSYRLEYAPGTNTMQFVSTATASDKTKIIIAIVRFLTSSVVVSYLGPYSVDGILMGVGGPSLPTDGTLIGDATAINFDFDAGLLRLAGAAVRACYGTEARLMSAQNLALPVTGVWHRLFVNSSTGALSSQPASTQGLAAGLVSVGSFNVAQQLVNGVPRYFVNGKSASASAPLGTAERRFFNGRLEANYASTPMAEFKQVLGSSHTMIYGLYDALVAAHPSYVSKTVLGQDGNGADICRYDFRPPPVETVAQSAQVPKMILISGAHGYEKAGVWAVYLAMKKLCEEWRTHETLETMRWCAHFIVVPIAVPYGWDTHGRRNENGVDVARNFPAGWVLTDPGEQTYGGTAPLTERSSQLIDAVFSANQDALYAGSFHNFFVPENPSHFLWNAGATRFGVGLAKSLISRQSRVWKARYAWLPQDETTYFGYTNLASPAGSEGYQATRSYGIQGGTFEISQSVPMAPDPDPFSSYVATMGVEAVVNWLALNLSQAAEFYNGRSL
ncbi:M14 family metallopeptidase [Variovorax boronicumulans]|uniref:M14 family metallopeptidase n=1 Tax=Variovorax boronicumulans TaxID=436515 RepID=UPI001C561CE2